MRCWSTVIQSLTPISWPTRVCSSLKCLKTRIGALPFQGSVFIAPAGYPLQQRLPLLDIALDAARRHVPQREAARGQVHVVLRVAQEAEHRHIERAEELLQVLGGDEAFARPHAHESDRDLVGAPVRLHFAQEVVRGFDVEQARLQRHHELVGDLQHLVQAPVVQPRRRVEHRMRRALGQAHDVVAAHFPAADLRHALRPVLQPVARRLLAIHVAQHHRMPLPRQRAGDIGRQRALAHATLGVGHDDDRHPRLRLNGWIPGYGSGRSEAPAILEITALPRRLMSDILVLAAHPDLAQSRVNQAMLRAARNAGDRVRVRDLYALYPDYSIDLPAEQAALADARLVVWLHPIHWYGMPALMKLWVDEVLSFGWAYGPGGHALRGKDLWLATSTGGREESYRPDRYNRYFFDAFLPPYDQTAALVGMRFLPPLVLHGAHRVDAAEL